MICQGSSTCRQDIVGGRDRPESTLANQSPLGGQFDILDGTASSSFSKVSPHRANPPWQSSPADNSASSSARLAEIYLLGDGTILIARLVFPVFP
jgi:hypothetical protein